MKRVGSGFRTRYGALQVIEEPALTLEQIRHVIENLDVVIEGIHERCEVSLSGSRKHLLVDLLDFILGRHMCFLLVC